MRTKASAKFHSLHPNQHKLLIGQIEKAKLLIGQIQPVNLNNSCLYLENGEAKDVSPEVVNMRRNKDLAMFTEEDRMREEAERKSRITKKRLTWSEDLIKVQIILRWESQTQGCSEIQEF